MIQYTIKYDLNDGQGWISFESAGEGFVSAQYNRGTIQGHWDGEKLKGQFIDTVSNGKGLIEFSFNETGFDAKWKAGIEEGPMKGKWVGKIVNSISKDENILSGKGIESYKRYLSYFLSKDEFDGDVIPSIYLEPLGKKFFQELLPDLEVLSFELDNDESAKSEGGNWSYTIFYHIPSGSILRSNFTIGAETFGEQFFDSKVIALNEYSIDMQSYRGLWNIRGLVSPLEDKWDISFYDKSLKSVFNPDVVSEISIENIKTSIDADVIFEFVSEVINLLKSKS
jgi:hypothetical protein